MKALETSDTCEIEYFGIMQTLVIAWMTAARWRAQACCQNGQKVDSGFSPAIGGTLHGRFFIESESHKNQIMM